MIDKDYIKLTLKEVNGRNAVEVDLLASKETLTNMIFSAMSNNKFFADSVFRAIDNYYMLLNYFDERAKLN